MLLKFERLGGFLVRTFGLVSGQAQLRVAEVREVPSPSFAVGPGQTLELSHSQQREHTPNLDLFVGEGRLM